jgi:hypothetical protein
LPELPPRNLSSEVANAADCSGAYTSIGGKQFSIRAEKNGLMVVFNGHKRALEPRGPDAFLCSHPDLALFPLRFGRENGTVVEASYGADWYVNERYRGKTQFDSPPEWSAYPGHYRVSTRHHINFRVVLRKGRLWTINPDGGETELMAIQAGMFRIGDSPEWLRFDTVVNGQSLRVDYSGSYFHRDFMP